MPLKSLQPLFGKKVLLLTHAGADVDAISSAAAIHFSLKGKANTSIGVPEHLNTQASELAKKLKIPFQINPSLDGFDAILCLDFNKGQMLGALQGDFAKFKGEKFLIDHHSQENSHIASEKNSYVKKSAVSATELVFELLEKSKVKIPKPAYLCIAAGIITDSSSFLIADHKTFAIMAKVMQKADVQYSDITSLFSVQRDLSEKVARLKAAKRCRIFKSGECVIAISKVGAFEADSAAALVRIGADVAFCGFSDKGAIRVSGRADNFWRKKHSFDLAADVFNKLESFFEGEGGGHPGAAGFNGKGKMLNRYF